MNKERLISEHPVEPAVREQILDYLRRIEAEHDVQVLFACESGSRGWGFASPDSDYDVRFIYVHRLAWYLTVDAGRDVIEVPISGDLDINGWDLRKALQLLKRSNPVLLEWLQSPIVYEQRADEITRLSALALANFSAVRGYHHYLSMAQKAYRAYLQDSQVRYKKYFYALRPLLAARWVYEGRGVPPMRFAELAEAMLDDDALIAEINRLLEVKMRSSEAARGAPWQRIQTFIESELVAAADRTIAQPRTVDGGALDTFLAETVLKQEQERQNHDRNRRLGR